MADRVVQTGVTLRCDHGAETTGGALEVTAEVWADIEEEGALVREGGQFMYGELPARGDPMRALIELAYAQRDQNLGSILGDLRRGGADVTRFECYAAPFRVELDDRLRAALSGRWDERDPRV